MPSPLARALANLLHEYVMSLPNGLRRIGFRFPAPSDSPLLRALVGDTLRSLDSFERPVDELVGPRTDFFAHFVVRSASDIDHWSRRLGLDRDVERVYGLVIAEEIALEICGGERPLIALLGGTPMNSLRDRLTSVTGDVGSGRFDHETVLGSGDLKLSRLACLIFREAAGPLFDTIASDQRHRCEWRLESVLRHLINAYQRSTDCTEGWLPYWYRHVEIGTVELASVLSQCAPGAPSLVESCEKYLFPCFALPNPDARDSVEYSKPWRDDEAIAEAIDAYWSTRALIDESVAAIVTSRRANGTLNPASPSGLHMGSVPLDEFDRGRSGKASKGSAFIELLTRSCQVPPPLQRHQVFEDLTEEEFFNPTLPSEAKISVVVGDSPQSFEGLGSDLFVVDARPTVSDATSVIVQSVPICVRIPMYPHHTASAADVSSSGVSLVCEARLRREKYRFVEHSRRLLNDELELSGTFQRLGDRTGGFKYEPREVRLSVDLPAEDPLKQKVRQNSTCRLVLLPPSGAVLMTKESGRQRGGRRKGELQVACEVDFDASGAVVVGDEPPSCEHGRGENITMVVFDVLSPAPRSAVTVDGQEQGLAPTGSIPERALCIQSGFIVGHGVPPDESHKVRVDSQQLEIQVVDREVDPRDADSDEVPMAAAVRGVEVDYEGELTRSPSVVEDLRSHLEHMYAAQISASRSIRLQQENGSWCLGLIALQEDSSLDELGIDAQQSILKPRNKPSPVWPFAIGEGVPRSFLESQSVGDFVTAFDDLGVHKILDDLRQKNCGGWISKIDYRASSDMTEAKVDVMLSAYRRMVEEARHTSPAARFWALFPYSVSIWQDTNSCQAVYLSPLHPLRLAWQFSTQRTFWRAHAEETDDRELISSLGGVVSGWNIPALVNFQGTALAALPLNPGPQSFFCGWSLLARTSAVLGPLAGPASVAGISAPGVDANSLSPESIGKAIGDFTAANRFVSTMTLDLASETPAPRSRFVDDAVAEALLGASYRRRVAGGWIAERRQLGCAVTGIRVLDSSNRRGDPRHDLLDLPPGFESAVSASWSRYEGRVCEGRVNVRIVGDATSRTKLAPGAGQATGSVSRNVLRRFDLVVSEGSRVMARIRSGVMPHASTSTSATVGTVNAFAGALAAVECYEQSNDLDLFTAIEVSLNDGLSFIRQADWVVLGDVGIPPAAYTTLLKVNNEEPNENAVVWDWQPPFLSAKQATSYGVIDRRPYLAVAQMPVSLRQRMERLVDTLAPGATPEDLRGQVLSLIQVLGTRGLGYSRLLKNINKYSTFEKGALGLAVTLGLIDEATKGWGDAILIPLDTAEPFLRSLGAASEQAKKADLLLLLLDETKRDLVMVPIEIKMLGVDQPAGGGGGAFPATDARELDRAKAQVEESRRLLQLVVARWKDAQQRSTALLPLFATALASLMDIGIRTRPSLGGDETDLARGLQALGAGDLSLRVGEGVVMYYTPSDTDKFAIRRDGSTRLAFVTPEHAYRVSRDSNADSELSSALQQMLRGAAGFGAPAPVSAPAPAPVSAPAPAPVSAPAPATHEETLPPEPLIRGDGIRCRLGSVCDVVPEEQAELWLSNTQLGSPHVGVVGMTGSGKTQFCSALVLSMRRLSRETQSKPMSGLVLDYKDDYSKPNFVRATGAVTWPPHRLPVDLFEIRGERTDLEINRRVGSFVDVVKKIFRMGNVQVEDLRTTVFGLMKTLGRSPTIKEIEDKYCLDIGGTVDGVVSVLRTWTRNEIFETDPTKLASLTRLLDGNLAVLSLQSLRGDELAQNATVALMLNAFNESIVGLPRDRFQGTDPQLRVMNSFILVDEAHNIMEYEFAALNRLLLEGRAYGVSVILSSQTLSHFESNTVNYREQIRSWFIHKTANVRDRELESLGLRAERGCGPGLAHLRNFEFAYGDDSGSVRLVRGKPFFEVYAQMSPTEQSW
jgi:hypothetical protein